MEPKTKKIALATLFGALISLSKVIVPSPLDKVVIGVQALLLALGALSLERMGATYVAIIGGSLTALWRISFAPFTFAFALLYGLFIDISFLLLKVKTLSQNAIRIRLIVSLTLSTALLGFLSYYTTVFILDLLPRNLMLEVGMLIIGTLNGLVAGYFTYIVWNGYLMKAFRL